MITGNGKQTIKRDGKIIQGKKMSVEKIILRVYSIKMVIKWPMISAGA